MEQVFPFSVGSSVIICVREKTVVAIWKDKKDGSFGEKAEDPGAAVLRRLEQ